MGDGFMRGIPKILWEWACSR